MADSSSTVDNYGPAVRCGRELARRALPPHVRAVYVELQRYARAPGAISDGIEWVAVPRKLLRDATVSLGEGWRPQEETLRDANELHVVKTRREMDQPTFRPIPDRRQAGWGDLSGARRHDDPR